LGFRGEPSFPSGRRTRGKTQGKKEGQETPETKERRGLCKKKAKKGKNRTNKGGSLWEKGEEAGDEGGAKIPSARRKSKKGG